MKTTNGRKLTAKAQEALRFRVVRAIVEDGLRKIDAKRTFGVGYSSIHGWLKAYYRGGWDALKCKKRGPKKSSRLIGWQAATIVRLIEDRCPNQLKLPFVLWTRDAVGELIWQRFGIALSVWTVGRYLKRWGFTPQKPLRRAYEQDPEAVQRWIADEYPAIARRAKSEKALVYWGDQMGLRSDHQAGTSYGRRGQTPVVTCTGRRFGCSMMSALTNRGQLAFMVYKVRFEARVMIAFMRRLIKHSPEKVFLIVDRHPVHVSAAVRRWVEARSDRIELFFMPGYSPELNPDEYLNNDVKANAVGRQRPKDQLQMMSQVRSYLRSTQKRRDIVKKFFHHKDVLYAAS